MADIHTSIDPDAFADWLDIGIREGFCSIVTCAQHGSLFTEDEAEQFEEGEDPCIHVVRINTGSGWTPGLVVTDPVEPAPIEPAPIEPTESKCVVYRKGKPGPQFGTHKWQPFDASGKWDWDRCSACGTLQRHRAGNTQH